MLVTLLFFSQVFADTLILKSGRQIDGKIIEETDTTLTIDYLGSEITYLKDEIEKIFPAEKAVEDKTPAQQPVAASRKNPDFEQAMQLFKEKNYTESNIYLEKLIANNPKAAGAYIIASFNYYRLKEYDQAIKSAQAALDIRPDNLSAQIAMFLALRKTGEIEKSQQYFEAVLGVIQSNENPGFAFLLREMAGELGWLQ